MLYLDLKKAFDTIDHEILLRKLDYYGIRGNANALIRSYLTSRSQFVQINGTSSEPCHLRVGVPQGSNLGPLLFLLYVNDLPNLKLHGKPRLFADDTALSYESSDPNDIVRLMAEDLSLLQSYFVENLLSLNLSKTKFMIFYSPRLGLPDHRELIVDGVKIEEVDKFKYLGLHLDSNLKWAHHIEALQNDVSSTCGLLWKLSKFMPTKQLIAMYHAFVHSKLQYLVAIWGAAGKTKLRALQLVQKRCLKAVYRRPRLYPSLLLFKEATPSTLPVLALREMQCVTQIHNMIKNPHAHHNQSLIQLQHRYATRHHDNLSISKPNTEIGKQSFSFFAKSAYNALPVSLKNEPNMQKFKSKIKQLLRANLAQFLN